MTEIVNRRRNIYINSEQYHTNNGDVNLVFPGNDFAVDKNEHMRLSLESFTMNRKWYNVNSTNNIFYIRDKDANHTPDDPSTWTYTEVKIQPGDYYAFDPQLSTSGGMANQIFAPNSLAAAIHYALNGTAKGGGTINGNVIDYDPITRKFQFNMNNAQNFDKHCDFVCFQVNDDSPKPDGVSEEGFFNDSCELLGGRPTRSSHNIISAFHDKTPNNTGGAHDYASHYPAMLHTLKAIHLRTNLQTHSYQTENFSARSETSSLTPSNIFAKIHVQRDAQLERDTQIISYVDSGSDLFSVDLQNKILPGIILKLTDDKGRPLTDSVTQLSDGNLSYLATIKWSAISQPMVGKESGYPMPDMQMKLYHGM